VLFFSNLLWKTGRFEMKAGPERSLIAQEDLMHSYIRCLPERGSVGERSIAITYPLHALAITQRAWAIDAGRMYYYESSKYIS
jgi:hypothetical protein